MNRDGLIELHIDAHGVPTPCIVTPSAFAGQHEGGRWVAFPSPTIPRGAIDSETVVIAWFAKNSWRVGAGDTPDAAVASLVERLDESARVGRARITREG